MDITKKDLRIPSYDIIKQKNVPDLKMIDVIALVLHAFENSKIDEIATYYVEFNTDISKQHENGWPKLLVKRNDYKKRFDIYCTEPFVRTQNMLTLLIRMVYIERFKKSWKLPNHTYHKILSRHLGTLDKILTPKSIKEVSFMELLQLLELCIKYYTTIYYDELLLEYQLGVSIMRHLNT